MDKNKLRAGCIRFEVTIFSLYKLHSIRQGFCINLPEARAASQNMTKNIMMVFFYKQKQIKYNGIPVTLCFCGTILQSQRSLGNDTDHVYFRDFLGWSS